LTSDDRILNIVWNIMYVIFAMNITALETMEAITFGSCFLVFCFWFWIFCFTFLVCVVGFYL